MEVSVAQLRLVLQSHGLQPARLLCPRNSPGKNTGMGCHFLLQGIFPAQGSKLGPLYCRQSPYHLSHQGSPLKDAEQAPILAGIFCNLLPSLLSQGADEGSLKCGSKPVSQHPVLPSCPGLTSPLSFRPVGPRWGGLDEVAWLHSVTDGLGRAL